MDASKASLWKGKFPVLVIAHRGFSGIAPENTLAAFRKAIEARSDMIELDVRLSKDGEVIVLHDDTLERTTNGKGRVSNYMLAELKELDAGSWFGPEYSGERIPALREVLELARDRIRINIELKAGGLGQYTVADLSDRSLHEVERAEVEDQVLFSSFDLTAIRRIKAEKTGLPVALITGSLWSSPEDLAGKEFINILACKRTVLNEKNLLKARQKGIGVHVWTVDTEEEMIRFISMGVDGIVTNHPARLIMLLQKRSPRNDFS